MRRLLLPFFFLFVAPSFASATWIDATVAELQKTSDGRVVAVVVLRDDKGNQDKFSFPADLKDVRGTILTELARRNATEAVIDIAVGTVVSVPAPSVTTPPSADDLAVTEFQGLVNAWRVTLAEQQAGLALQSDVDAAKSALLMPFQKATPAVRARMDLILVAVTRGSGIQ